MNVALLAKAPASGQPKQRHKLICDARFEVPLGQRGIENLASAVFVVESVFF
jgi:hypothetical protein